MVGSAWWWWKRCLGNVFSGLGYILSGSRDRERSKKIRRHLELTRRHLVVPFSKLGKNNNKKELGPREKNQDEKLLSVTYLQDF